MFGMNTVCVNNNNKNIKGARQTNKPIINGEEKDIGMLTEKENSELSVIHLSLIHI